MILQLINLISNLPSGTVFSITTIWLNSNGINANANNAKLLGSKFAKIYFNYNCKLVGKHSNNLNVYEKV